MRIPSGYLYYDTPIGILCLDTLFPKPPGQLRNPLTFDFPDVCRVLRGVGAKEIMSSTSAQLETLFVDAAPRTSGTGSKPSPEAAASWPCFRRPWPAPFPSRCSCPALSRSRSSIPCTARAACIGVLTAHSGSLTPEHFRQAGVPDAQIDALAIAGMENFPVFRKTILEGPRPSHGHGRRGREIGAAAARHDGRAAAGRPAAPMPGSSVFARTVQGGGFRRFTISIP
ncbi:MAG: aspartate/glutamate racemase family protein [Bilophila wadsworthia]